MAQALERQTAPGALPGGIVFEPKYDGYRLLVFAHGGEAFPAVAKLRDRGARLHVAQASAIDRLFLIFTNHPPTGASWSRLDVAARRRASHTGLCEPVASRRRRTTGNPQPR
ncbi:hypothetical protein OHT93_00905 [Streptomyces sp. NBC_00191]|uniref:hypothetical protein n=1 Tax=Streptomyces sp. NBC_00191 TaxID=2975674 RepID=UPI00324AFCE5